MKAFLRLLLASLVFFSTSSYAQSMSRVFFYRNDRFLTHRNTGHIYLFCNGKRIDRSAYRDFSIYNTDDIKGTYSMQLRYLMNKFDKHSTNLMLDRSPDQNSIVFVQVVVHVGFFKTKYVLKEVSPAEFKNFYNKKKWIRKRLKEAGYKSIDDVISGYHPVL